MQPGLIVLMLSLLLGLQPITTDLYLPALPALTAGFGAPIAQAQLTLSALLLAFGLSQLVWGPLSDRFGRRPVLLVGMSAYVLASVGSTLSASMEILIVWRTVQGVAEINSNGGHQRQVTIEPMLDKLKAANMTVGELADIIRGNVENAGGGVISRDGEQLTVRSVGRVGSAEEIAQLPIKLGAALQPLKVEDVAKVQWGAGFRGGAATMDGEEVVLGTIMMLMGQNARTVCQLVKPRLDEIREKLPDGMDITVVYDRSDLVTSTVGTVQKNLGEGAIFIVLVLLLLLGNLRAALIVALMIPLSFLFAACGMVQGGWSANLMSLGALDFGLIIDGAIFMVENIIRRLGIKQHHLGRVPSLRAHVIGDRPSDHTTASRVDDCAAVDPSITRAVLADVGKR